MKTHSALDIKLLSKFISSIFSKAEEEFTLEKILSRTVSEHEGTFPAEIIKCRLSNKKKITLRLKYAFRKKEKKLYIQRDGIEYEGNIYSQLLEHIPLTTVRYYGNEFIKKSKEYCLVLEYLDDCYKIKQVGPKAFSKAAEWIASFHILFESNCLPFVRVYDENYYRSWADKIEISMQKLNKKFYWVQNLFNYYRENINILTASPQTVIHGEFYGKNVLIRDGIIYPIDWETAAYGPAEIDVACLMEGKDEVRAKLAIEGYKTTRWHNKNDIPELFEKRLLMARLYFTFRWLAEWTMKEDEIEAWLRTEGYGNALRLLARETNCV